MKVFVINAYPDRREKYDERYELFPAVWWEDVTDEQLDQYNFYWNAKLEHRKKVTACALSHKKLLQKVIIEDLEDVIIMEDDALIDDFEKLDVLKDVDDFCYVGGQIAAPLVKDYVSFQKDKKQGIIDLLKKDKSLFKTIEPENFRITHACGYYIPNKKVAEKILSSIDELYPNRKKAIDVMFVKLQKKDIIKSFIFPALVTLYLPDAKKGFTYSKYKLTDDQWLY